MVKKIISQVLPFLLLFFLWEIISRLIIKNSFSFPPLSLVLYSFYELRDFILFDIVTSIGHLLIGFMFAIITGVLLGILIGWFNKFFYFINPLIEIIRPIPPIAWIPIAIIWFHLTHIAAGFIIFIGAFFPILINTYTGIKNTPKVLIESAMVLGCTNSFKIIRYVSLPFAMPFITTGMRIGMGIGWMCVVAAEMFGVSRSGIGYRLFQRFYYFHQMDYVIAYMLLLGIISMFMDKSFRLFIEEKILRWQKGIIK